MSDVFLVSAVRTPIGRFGGAFKDLTAADLAAVAMKAALERARRGRRARSTSTCSATCCAPGRGSSFPDRPPFKAGIPKEIDGSQLDMVCSSGMMAVMNAAAMIKAGEADLVLAGGTE